MINPQALYIHIPFCDSICAYCDFYKMMAKPALKARYIDALCAEIDMHAALFSDLKTVYIGGGTPLAVGKPLFEQLLRKIAACVDVGRLTEYTVEVNPHDIKPEILPLLRFYGITRVNIGVESFNALKLKILGRNHDKQSAVEAIKRLKEAGFANIGVDLIYGVDYRDSFRKVKADLRHAVKLGISHISLYALIIEEKTILKQRLDKGLYRPCPDDREAVIYRKAVRYLERKGFNRYEMSNFAKPGFESRHNCVYWNNENYLGLGAGAAGYLDDVRYTNVRHLETYISAVQSGKNAYGERVELALADKMKEEVILGLRKTEGINIKTFANKYNKDITVVFPVIDELLAKGLLRKEGDNLFIPEDKVFLSNEVLVNFI
ncbi:MAG TPA: radical SAM family heme chaperone HemW [Acholeplasmataceae bacterium]|jgi:putative oxygen-independent coproporphyrinogen III oxidase|nr:radical SAM family heme chaperone HemW [Acholeplasmataceae bacterium]